MAQFLSLVIAGAISGGLYAMVAGGLVLTYQASGIFNLAHGAIAFVVALTFYVLHQPAASGGVGLGVIPAGLIAVLVVAPLIGLLLDVAVFRRLARAPEAAKLVGTIGVLIALPAAAMLTIDSINAFTGSNLPNAAGDQGVAPPGFGPSPARHWSLTTGVTITSDQVMVVVAAALCALGLWFLLRRTRLGLETRAGVDRPALALLRGIDTDRSSRLIWVIASALAGLTGILLAPLFDLSALTFNMIVFISFTAAVAAGLKSVPRAFVAGLALGVVQNLVNGYAPRALAEISGFRTAVPFILLFVLMFLMRNKERAAGTMSEEVPAIDLRAGLPRWRRWLPWVVGSMLLGAYTFLFADTYWRGVIVRGLVLGLVFLSFVVVTGFGGMINLAQATFITAGGFTAGWLVNHQWPQTIPVIMDNGRLELWVALIAAVVLTTVVGLVAALPSLRLGGLQLAIATLALAFIGDRLIFQLERVRNGSRGWSVRRPGYGPVDLSDDRVMFIVLMVLLVGVVWIISNLRDSATGRAVLAVRSSEIAASTSGVRPLRTKLVVFAVSAALAGLGGVLYAMINSPITNHSVPPMLGIVWLAVAVTFGIRRPGGVILAGLVYSILPVVLTGIGRNWKGEPWVSIPGSVRDIIGDPSLAALLFGLGAVALAREPDGVLASVNAVLHRYRGRTGDIRIETVEPLGSVESAEPRDAAEFAGPQQADEGDDRTSVEVVDEAPILEVVDVRAGYGDLEVLHGVDLVLGRGTSICVLGANGAGKTTLASVLAGLVIPTSGRVMFEGVVVTSRPVHLRARSGLFVSPEARGIFPSLTVEENLTVRLRSHAARQAAYERFSILGERRGQPAGLLSGGEQQLLALASALVEPPKVLIIDEPMLGLSPQMVHAVTMALGELRSAGVAMMFLEEQPVALELADTVIVMQAGEIVWSGPTGQISAESIAVTYLGGVAREP